MTERGPFTGMRGAPGPAEPSNSGDSPASAGRPRPAQPQATRPQTAQPQAGGGLPADLSAVRRTDAILDSLAARRAAGSAPRSPTAPETSAPDCARQRQADDPDPAVRLLHALITDVDDQGTGPEPAPPGPGSRRRGPRTIVALGVAGAVLASTGVAAAGGGVTDRTAASPPPSTAGVSGEPEKPGGPDTDAGWHENRPRSPVRPVADPEPPAPRKPSGDDDPKGRDPVKPRPRHLFPQQRPPRRADRPDAPAMTTYSTPARGTDDRPTADRPAAADGGTRRQLDDIRDRTPRRIYPYQNRRHHQRD